MLTHILILAVLVLGVETVLGPIDNLSSTSSSGGAPQGTADGGAPPSFFADFGNILKKVPMSTSAKLSMMEDEIKTFNSTVGELKSRFEDFIKVVQDQMTVMNDTLLTLVNRMSMLETHHIGTDSNPDSQSGNAEDTNTTTGSDGCPTEYTYVGSLNWCYKIHQSPEINRVNALTTCAGEGGGLLKIDNLAKQNTITTALQAIYDPNVLSRYYINGKRNESGIWIYDDETVITEFFWRFGNEAYEDLTYNSVYLTVTYDYKWRPGKDGQKRNFICEIKV